MRRRARLTGSRQSPILAAALLALLLAAATLPLEAQFGGEPQKPLPAPAVDWDAEQDQKNMMDQLGIKALRPGLSGDESAPDHANYDELLGAKRLGMPADYRTATMPPVNAALLSGQLAGRQHDGGHTDAPNFKTFTGWAGREMGRTVHKD